MTKQSTRTKKLRKLTDKQGEKAKPSELKEVRISSLIKYLQGVLELYGDGVIQMIEPRRIKLDK